LRVPIDGIPARAHPHMLAVSQVLERPVCWQIHPIPVGISESVEISYGEGPTHRRVAGANCSDARSVRIRDIGTADDPAKTPHL